MTGSGKTEVYLRLSAFVQSRARTVLMLVPEIALTPAAVAFFRSVFGDRVAIQHSGLSDGERHDQWQRIRRGDVDIVVGTRSAVFAPLPRLGLVVVDEEHDSSYKQEESPRYNGRDVAIVRAQRAGALVVLGSATPSMETYQRATTAKYDHIALERRVLDRPLASVTVVDMREEYAAGGPDVVLSRALVEGVGATPRARRAVAGSVEPPRFCDGRVLPAVRGNDRLPELQRVARRARRRARGAARAATTATTRRASHRRVRPAPRRTWSRPGSAPSAWRPK